MRGMSVARPHCRSCFLIHGACLVAVICTLSVVLRSQPNCRFPFSMSAAESKLPRLESASSYSVIRKCQTICRIAGDPFRRMLLESYCTQPVEAEATEMGFDHARVFITALVISSCPGPELLPMDSSTETKLVFQRVPFPDEPVFHCCLESPLRLSVSLLPDSPPMTRTAVSSVRAGEGVHIWKRNDLSLHTGLLCSL